MVTQILGLIFIGSLIAMLVGPTAMELYEAKNSTAMAYHAITVSMLALSAIVTYVLT